MAYCTLRGVRVTRMVTALRKRRARHFAGLGDSANQSRAPASLARNGRRKSAKRLSSPFLNRRIRVGYNA